MLRLGVILGQYLSALWTMGLGVQEADNYPLAGIFCLISPNIQLRGELLLAFKEPVHPPETSGRLPIVTDVMISSCCEGGVPTT